MAAFSAELNNIGLNAEAARFDVGAGPATIDLLDGTQPSRGGADTNILASVTMNATAFAVTSNELLTANAIADDSNAALDGDCTWARVRDGDGVFLMDIPASELTITPSTTIVQGANVSVSPFTINAGNK